MFKKLSVIVGLYCMVLSVSIYDLRADNPQVQGVEINKLNKELNYFEKVVARGI